MLVLVVVLTVYLVVDVVFALELFSAVQLDSDVAVVEHRHAVEFEVVGLAVGNVLLDLLHLQHLVSVERFGIRELFGYSVDTDLVTVLSASVLDVVEPVDLKRLGLNKHNVRDVVCPYNNDRSNSETMNSTHGL